MNDREIREKIDIEEIYIELNTGRSGDQIFIYPDGSTTTHSSGTVPAPGSTCIAILRIHGDPVLDDFSDNFADPIGDDGEFRIKETGEIVSEEKMIRASVEEGDFDLDDIVYEIEHQANE